jgi:hypothetical protein
LHVAVGAAWSNYKGEAPVRHGVKAGLAGHQIEMMQK